MHGVGGMMGGWRQAVSSELWLFAKREGESPEGSKEMGDHRVAAAHNCNEGEVIRNFPAKCFLSFFCQKFLQETANFSEFTTSNCN